MLSETKDPLRVQPHLKKCFEGIAKLDFSPEIIALGMVSAENETVAFVNQINPAEAKVRIGSSSCVCLITDIMPYSFG